jgi:hypothetical protein
MTRLEAAEFQQDDIPKQLHNAIGCWRRRLIARRPFDRAISLRIARRRLKDEPIG